MPFRTTPSRRSQVARSYVARRVSKRVVLDEVGLLRDEHGRQPREAR
jgi:hypothetical protein